MMDAVKNLLFTAGISILFGGVQILTSLPAGAGQLDQGKIAVDSRWQPTGCHVPVPPSTKVYDIVTYNVAVSQFNTYRAEVDAYFICASGEAEHDFKKFRAILTASLESIQSAVLIQFDGLKADLELSQKAFK